MHFLFNSLISDFDNNFYKNIYIFAISFFSNTFSAISGGGAGLIQLPALVLFGVPYYQALSTHKIATVALGLGGSIRNYKVLINDVETIIQILIFGLPGVVCGTSIVKYISDEYLLFVFHDLFLKSLHFYQQILTHQYLHLQNLQSKSLKPLLQVFFQ